MRGDLTRQSTGLSSAHRELIRMLAERAVADYLAELEAAETTCNDEMLLDREGLTCPARRTT